MQGGPKHFASRIYLYIYIYIYTSSHAESAVPSLSLALSLSLSLAIRLYRPSLLAGPLDCIQCHNRVDACKSLLVDKL